MDIWQGSITVPSIKDTTQTLDNISLSTHLVTPAPSTSVVNHLRKHLSTSTLSFLRYVPPSSVPFYLAAGPSLQVTTTSPSAAYFLQTFFLSALPKSAFNDGATDVLPPQPQLSILLRVTPPPQAAPKPGSWTISELLLYGALSAPPPSDVPTPPSSPPRHSTPIITLHALPLSSTHNFTPYLSAPAFETPRFIAPNPQDIINPVISSAARKRRAETLDKAAEQKTKKPKFPVLGALGKSGINSRGRGGGSPTPASRKSSFSLGGRSRAESVAAATRPGSSAGHERRGSFSLVRAGSIVPPPPRPGSSAGATDVETKNKDVVNRMVLEEMKRRGMRDYRKTGTEDEKEREEFKGVFHHAVKAAVFAMRKEMGDGVAVGMEKVRNVVRRLVDVFLDEPAADGVLVKKEDIEA